jgi:hypothetical protein
MGLGKQWESQRTMMENDVRLWTPFTSKLEKEAHHHAVLDATRPFRLAPFHSYGGHSGPWIENHWISSFAGRNIEAFGPYVPLFVQWVDITLWGEPDFSTIEAALAAVLRQDVMYITVAQGAEGLKYLTLRFPNILVLSAGGYGHVPIPLVKGHVGDPPGTVPLGSGSWHNRGQLLAFVGRILKNRRGLVRVAQRALGDGFIWFRGDGDKWKDVVRSGRFYLAPRGFGRTTFALAEAIQLGTPPVYVWDEVEWLPYKGSPRADFSLYGLSLNMDLSTTTPDPNFDAKFRRTLEQVSEGQWRAMVSKIGEIRDSHYTYAGIIEQISRFMLGGDHPSEAGSDLRCEALPRSGPGILEYGEGLEGMFGSLESNGDDLIGREEFLAAFESFDVQSMEDTAEGTDPGKGSKTIRTSLSESQSMDLMHIMDADADGMIDFDEWMSRYPVANEKMKAYVVQNIRASRESQSN